MTQWYVTQQTIKQLVDVGNWEHEVLKLDYDTMVCDTADH